MKTTDRLNQFLLEMGRSRLSGLPKSLIPCSTFQSVHDLVISDLDTLANAPAGDFTTYLLMSVIAIKCAYSWLESCQLLGVATGQQPHPPLSDETAVKGCTGTRADSNWHIEKVYHPPSRCAA